MASNACELTSTPLIRWFERRAAEQAGSVAFRFKDRAIWRDVTWLELSTQVKALALGLDALGLGIKGRALWVGGVAGPAWPAVELAVQALGASVCAIDPDSTRTEELCELTQRLAPHAVIVSQLEDLQPIADQLESRVIALVLTGTSARIIGAGQVNTVTLAELQDLGVRSEAADQRWQRLISERSPYDVIRIAATSGVDTAPRLVALSSRDVLRPWSEFFLSGDWAARPGTDDRTIALQPVAHTFELVLGLVLPIVCGVIAHFPESAASREINLVEVSPTIVIARPRLWQMWSSGVLINMRDAGWLKRVTFGRLAEIRQRQLAGGRSGPGARLAMAPAEALWRWALRRPLLTKLGLAEARTAVIGGASVPSSLLTTWRSWGVPLMEIYGGAETADLVAVRSSSADPAGPLTVLSGVEPASSAEGEITLRRGAGVSTSYFNTAGHDETLTHEFRTGDLGVVEGRQLSVLGRRADRVELVDGRKLALDRIEERLEVSPYIHAAVVVCPDLEHPAALLEISYRDLAEHARSAGVAYTSYESLASSDLARQVCAELVAQVNDSLRADGTPAVRDFRVLPRPLSPAFGELTPTRKICRRRVVYQFHTTIEEMYPTTGQGEVTSDALR